MLDLGQTKRKLGSVDSAQYLEKQVLDRLVAGFTEPFRRNRIRGH
jgi:hypothetical protein